MRVLRKKSVQGYLATFLALISFSTSALEERYTFESVAQQAQFERLSKEIRCVTCANQSIIDSNAPVANAMQDAVYLRIKRGESVEDIHAYLKAHYGESVLYAPSIKKETFALWWAPLLMFLLAIIGWCKWSR